MKIKKTVRTDKVDLQELYEESLEKYGQVFIEDFGESGTFLFHSLGRKDFRDLRDSEAIGDYAKEEIICEQCTIYPKNYDFENCEEAGLPSLLAQKILEKSLLKDSDQLVKAIHYFRDKLVDSMDDQITCIIHEAFPENSIEDIANWDVIKTADYMTRAEYILHNLRGVPIVPTETSQQAMPQEPSSYQPMEDRFQPVEPIETRHAPEPPSKEKVSSEKSGQNKTQTQEQKQKAKPKSKGRTKLTPEKLRELQMKFPEIDWAHDSVAMKGISALQGQEVDDRPAAERSLDEKEEYNQEALPLAVRDRFKVIGKG